MQLHKEDLDGNIEYNFNEPIMVPSSLNNFKIYMKDGAKVIFEKVKIFNLGIC